MPRPLPRLVPLACVALAALAPIARAQDDAKPAGAFDLAHVPADAPVVVAFRPAALLALPDVKALYEEMTRDPEVRRAVDVAEPETVAQVTLALARRDLPGKALNDETLAGAGLIVVKTTRPREWKALAAAGGVPLTKATHAGKDYFRMAGDGPAFGYYQPDETTLVVASEANLLKLLDGSMAKDDAAPPVAKPSVATPGTPLAMVAVDQAWVREMADPVLKSEPQAALGLSVVGPIWEQTDRVTVGLSAAEDGTTTLLADHVCRDEDGARAVEATVQALLTLGRNVAPEGLKLARREARDEPLAADLITLAEKALESAKVTRDGARVRLEVAAKIDVARLVRGATHGR